MFPLCSEFTKQLYTLVLVYYQSLFYLNFIFRKYCRHYSKKSVSRINFIKWAQALGFNLKEIKELLAISCLSIHAREEVRHRIEFKLNAVERELKKLLRLKSVLG